MVRSRTATRTNVGFAVAVFMLFACVFLLALPAIAQAHVIERASVGSLGQGDGWSEQVSISADGRYVAFFADATNLVTGDTNGLPDVFVYDRDASTLTRVSVSSGGAEGNGGSRVASISADGRYVAFYSHATNLVADDTNGNSDVFVHDRNTGVTIRVSVDSAGVQADDASRDPVISADGRYVAFHSIATNLVAGDANAAWDIFVHDRNTGATTRVSVDSAEVESDGASDYASISGDGRYVAFQSLATNLVAGDTNAVKDIFVRDRTAGTTTRVSVDSVGTQGNGASGFPSMSADGNYVAFESVADNLVPSDTTTSDVFAHNMGTGATEKVSVDSSENPGAGSSNTAAVSSDGRFVTFLSYAANLVPSDTNVAADVFVRDRTAGTTSRVSVDSAGVQGDADSLARSISADGRYVAFSSYATNLVPGDTNGFQDVFVARNAFLLTYAAGGNGSISGVSPQIVSYGANGTAVTALPNGGYQFVSWSDGILTATRQDTNVTADVDVTANFAAVSYTLTYTAGAGGTISGTTPQTVAPGGDGTPVTAVPNIGYHFVKWSDDSTDNPRTDTNVTGNINVTASFAADGTTAYTSIIGIHRYHTAQLISQAMFAGALPAGSGAVVAPGETFPEALCGAPLAAAYGGPVLLTPTVGLENGTKAELQRLLPDYVFVIGLSQDVVDAVEAALPAATVTAINGTLNNIYDMSYKVAKALGAKVGDMSGATAIVTIGTNFPDAIGVSPLACSQLWPVLLTEYGDDKPLNASSAIAISELGITTAIKAGTYCTLPGGVTGLANLSGTDRYGTCANVANWAETEAGLSFDHTGLATGDKFPDALAAGPYLAKDNGSLLLSPLTGPLPPVIGAVIAANAAEVHHFSFIACIEPVISQVKALLP